MPRPSRHPLRSKQFVIWRFIRENPSWKNREIAAFLGVTAKEVDSVRYVWFNAKKAEARKRALAMEE